MIGARTFGTAFAAVLVIVAGSTACGVERASTTTREASSDMDTDRPVFDTWEEAAVAEAERLNPGLVDARADRVESPPSFERMRVRAAGGYCHIYGGKVDSRVGWQANDLGGC